MAYDRCHFLIKFPLRKNLEEVTCANAGDKVNILKVNSKLFSNNIINTIDVAFPIMHGTNGEDGTIQGYLELLGLPYVGCDIVSSSIGMDKIIMKQFFRGADLPVLPGIGISRSFYEKNPREVTEQI